MSEEQKELSVACQSLGDWTRTHTCGELTGADNGAEVCLMGWVQYRRDHGGLIFVDLRDRFGLTQIVFSPEYAPEAHEQAGALRSEYVLAMKGKVRPRPEGMVNPNLKTGEVEVVVSEWKLLNTSKTPPFQIEDRVEAGENLRLQWRYLDLRRPRMARNLALRSRTAMAIRNELASQGFLEVETPMLHPIPGGANAKPFVTHHNALDMDMYLRIAPELYLKRLVVGGFERVFEINRNFRNEGTDTRHNPEFTMMEFYATYWTYHDQMDFTEALIRHTAIAATGSAVINYQGTEIDLSKPFDRLTPIEAVKKFCPNYTDEELNNPEFLRAEIERLHGEIPVAAGLGALQIALFEETAESKLIQPTFIINHPTEISPLARASDTNPEITERFELYIAGRETANGFSELNDPDDQAARFRAQADKKSHGDDEAMYYDADFIRALEYGLPPTAGCGIGIDRLVMLLTDAPTIRDVLLFPHMRPEATVA